MKNSRIIIFLSIFLFKNQDKYKIKNIIKYHSENPTKMLYYVLREYNFLYYKLKKGLKYNDNFKHLKNKLKQ